MIGLTADKLLLIAVVVGFLFGPERLPHLAERLGSAVRAFRTHLTSTEQRMRDELSGHIDVNDWKRLDPRQYDPRTIIRDALTADTAAVTVTAVVHPEAVAVLDDRVEDAEQDPVRSADDSPGAGSSAKSEIRPVVRRRSDGHLESVQASAAADEAETELAPPIGARPL